MAEVTINYKDAAIVTMNASGTKTLQTQGKYCEDDIEVVYARPSAPSGTKQISITQNGTTLEDVAAYANAEITVNVQGGGGVNTLADLCNGNITRLDDDSVTEFLISLRSSTWDLQTIFLKNLKALSIAYCFSNKKVQTIVLPSLQYGTSASYFFSDASKLTKIDLGPNYSTETVGVRSGTFASVPLLNTIILRKNTVVPLQNINAFNATPFASNGSGGILYVPQARITEYTQATNWSTILGYANNQVLPIEGSIYETQYADGTPIT